MQRIKSLCPWLLSGRRGLALALLAAVAAGSVVAWAEHWGGLQPCALCWTQRLLMGLFAALALLGVVVWPKGGWGKLLLGVPLVGIALSGAAVAARHLYVVFNPEVVECGMSPELMVRMLPWQELILEFVTGHSDCARAGELLGVTLPLWSLFGFLALAGLSAYALLKDSSSG